MNKKNHNLKRTLVLVGLTSLSSCTPAKPPEDLVSARAAYARANDGPAVELNPSALSSAKDQLDVAEASFAQDGDTQTTRDESYVALRKTEFAEISARTLALELSKQQVVEGMHADESKTVALTSAELARTRQALATKGTELDHKTVSLETERMRRIEAEKRAGQATKDLARLATVSEEVRGTVITLSGSILFASAKWELLPAAQARLSGVADALVRKDPTSRIEIEGHTDAQGTPSDNQVLSQRRADAVRTLLVEHGIASDRVSAKGFGQTRPIADNRTTEGRANNRRVEIVVLPPKVVSR
jgi:outer membrane protein OmpA-like peptidoglycan-associated protein